MHILLLMCPHVQIAFLKFTSCDNRPLVGYIPISTVAVKISQSSHKIYSNNILNFQESTTILNACTKKSGNLLNAPRTKARVDKTQQKSKCRLYGERDETINHIISECNKLLSRHDWMGQVINGEMCKKFKFDHTNKLYIHNPADLLENETHKHLRSPNLGQMTRSYKDQEKKRELAKLWTLLSRLIIA